MNEEPVESPAPGREPVEDEVGQSTETKSSEAGNEPVEDVEQSTEKKSSDVENTSEAATAQEPLAPSQRLNTEETPSSDLVEETPGEEREDAKAFGGEPPIDWFEPLEDDDDANSDGSLAGESERSESVAGSEKAFKKIYQ